MIYDENDNGVLDEEEFENLIDGSDSEDEDDEDDDDVCEPAGDTTECGMVFNAADADCTGTLVGAEKLDFLDDPAWGND